MTKFSNLPSREEREAWANIASGWAKATHGSYRSEVERIAAFLRSDTLDHMAEAIRAANAMKKALSGLIAYMRSDYENATQQAETAERAVAARDAYRAARAKLED